MLPRERAVAFIRLAEEFHEGASRYDAHSLLPSFVAYYLYGHAIELALKSVQIVHGCSEDSLRKAGHNLRTSLDRVVQQLPRPLNAPETAVLDALNEYYAIKGFEYVKPGLVSLPLLTDVRSLSAGLIETLPGMIRTELGRAL